MLLDDLYEVIEKLRDKMKNHQDKLRQSEALTRSALVDPLLRALGWDTENPAQVIPEYNVSKVDGGTGTADYALLSSGNPAIVIEAKKLGASLADAANQCFQYCSKDGILYFVVTDGSIWDVYETNRPVAFAEKKIVNFDIKGPSADVCLDALVLWRRSLQDGTVRKAQAPLLEPQDDPPLAVNQPAKVLAPVVPIPSSMPVPAREGSWQTLPQWQVLGDKPPSEIRFPDGSTAKIRHWVDIPTETVRWLSQHGRLDETQIPVQSGKRYILSGSPIHSTGMEFRVRRQAGKFYVEGHYDKINNVKNARTIIVRAGKGVTLEQFSVRMPD